MKTKVEKISSGWAVFQGDNMVSRSFDTKSKAEKERDKCDYAIASRLSDGFAHPRGY